VLLRGRPSIFSKNNNRSNEHQERKIMPKQKLILYKPSGTIKQYDDVSVLGTDNVVRLVSLPDGRGTSISVGLIKFRNNQNGEEISTTLPYTIIFVTDRVGERNLRRSNSSASSVDTGVRILASTVRT
jgi:hypothetical protein